MKNKLLLIGFAILMLVSTENIVYAAPFVEINEIKILDDEIFVGDELDIKADFDIISDKTQLVRLSLYLDNKIKDTYTSFYPDGKFIFNFHYDTDYLSCGNHDLKIKIEIIEDDDVVDSASQTQTFKLEQITSNIYHNVEITKISIPKKASPNSKIPITISVENLGIIDESSMIIEIEINGKKYKSDYFYLEKKSKKMQTLYITTPNQKGEHQLTIKTNNPYVMDDLTTEICVEDISVIFKTDAINISSGKYIFAYGYIREESPSSNYIYIYKDNIYHTKLMPNSDGYFSFFVKFDNEGEHIISAKIYGIRRDIKINTYIISKINETSKIINETNKTIILTEIKNETINQSFDFIGDENETQNQNITAINNITAKDNFTIGNFILIDKIKTIDDIAGFALLIMLALLLLIAYKSSYPKAVNFKNHYNAANFYSPTSTEPTGIFPKNEFQKTEVKKYPIFKEKKIESESILDIPEPTGTAHWVSFRNMIK